MTSFLRKTVFAQSLGDLCLVLEEEIRKNDEA